MPRPDQWLANQSGQWGFLQDMASGWSLYAGGWGAGKTWSGARKFLLLHQLNRCPGLAVAPTYGDLWRVVVPAITAACASVRWPCRVVKSEPPHLLIGRHPVWLVSGDAPERFAGFEVGHLWVDEGARIPVSDDPLRDAPTQIRSRLRHPDARALHGLITTTHEGSSTWVYRDWFEKPKDRHRAYKGRTDANSALPSEYLADRLATLPAALREQYLEGDAVDYAGKRAHPGFHPARHHSAQEIDQGLPLHIGMDFNVSPLCWVLAQVRGSGRETRVCVVDELVIEDHATAEQAMHRADAQGWGKAVAVHLHPDRSSNNRTPAGNPIAHILAQEARAMGWRYTLRTDGGNPSVSARIALLDGLIDPYQGEPRLTVHPRCKRLTKELQSVGRLASGHYDPGKAGQHGHILDALGYLVWDEARPGGAWANA